MKVGNACFIEFAMIMQYYVKGIETDLAIVKSPFVLHSIQCNVLRHSFGNNFCLKPYAITRKTLKNVSFKLTFVIININIKGKQVSFTFYIIRLYYDNNRWIFRRQEDKSKQGRWRWRSEVLFGELLETFLLDARERKVEDSW